MRKYVFYQQGLMHHLSEHVSYPLVGLMSAAKVLQDNFSALAIDLGTKNLPQPKMSMDEFKSFIGFTEVEQQQERFLLTE